jgi:hypothetical protein
VSFSKVDHVFQSMYIHKPALRYTTFGSFFITSFSIINPNSQHNMHKGGFEKETLMFNFQHVENRKT